MIHKVNVIEAPFSLEISDQNRNNSLKSLKTSEYQSKINELSNQVKFLRQRMQEIERIDKNSIVSNDDHHNSCSKIAQLHKRIKALEEENVGLRHQNQKLRNKLKYYESFNSGKYGDDRQNGDKYDLQSVNSLKQFKNKNKNEYDLLSNKNSIKLSSGNSSNKTNLIRQLLIQCNEPKEYNQNKTDRKIDKDEFYEFKNTQDCFEPFYSALSKELRIRLKRCLIKQKELLVVDSNIQLGTICPYKINSQDSPQYTRMVIVITNISLHAISNITLQYVHSNDVSITRKYYGNAQDIITSKYKTTFPIPINSNEQVKEELQVIVNNIDFQSVKLNLSYEIDKRKYEHVLILPLSKIKLFREIPFTSTNKQLQRMQRVFQHEKKILNDMDKLKNCFAFVYQSREKGGNIKYSWKIQFMGKFFWIQSLKIEDKMSLAVLFESQRALAQKILKEYIFLFQKL